jgi:hypothetical protein
VGLLMAGTTNQALGGSRSSHLWQPFPEGRIKDAVEMTARNRNRMGIWGSKVECGV